MRKMNTIRSSIMSKITAAITRRQSATAAADPDRTNELLRAKIESCNLFLDDWNHAGDRLLQHPNSAELQDHHRAIMDDYILSVMDLHAEVNALINSGYQLTKNNTE
jgi:hypothetical protein